MTVKELLSWLAEFPEECKEADIYLSVNAEYLVKMENLSSYMKDDKIIVEFGD